MLPTNEPPDHPLAQRFRDLILDPPFPCVGAKSALSRGKVRIIIARDIASDGDDARIYAALLAFIARYRAEPEVFQSFVVIFDELRDLSEQAFEAALWSRMQALSDRDSAVGQSYDPRVAADPKDAQFAMSFGGEGFFVVGLHGRASRLARRFEAPCLVFNLHDQFERLRAVGRYERLRDVIVARDVAWAGSPNPMLAQHGERSAARQFSGRAVADDWNCPFRRAAASLAWDSDLVAADMRSSAFVVDERIGAPYPAREAPASRERDGPPCGEPTTDPFRLARAGA